MYLIFIDLSDVYEQTIIMFLDMHRLGDNSCLMLKQIGLRNARLYADDK